jgi:hypothetical protein
MTEGELKQVEGQIASIDVQGRHFALEDKAGIIFIKIVYSAKFDNYMRKQKIGFYEKPTVIMVGETSANLEDIHYVDRPADWQKSGGRKQPQRNERLIVVQVLIKAWTDLYVQTKRFMPEDEIGFDVSRKEILDAVEEDIDRVMKIGSEQK